MSSKSYSQSNKWNENIPQELLTSIDNDLKGKIPHILQVSWDYLSDYFTDRDEYLSFLLKLSTKGKYNCFLYTMFFFWAHDLRRMIDKEIKDPNIYGFMYQVTLSIIEYLNNNTSPRSKKRLENFFKNYFSKSDKRKIEKGIVVKPYNSNFLPQLDFWEVLYDMRNEFIHNAQWFILRFEDSDASYVSITRNNGDKYLARIEIHFSEYLKLFWRAYLRYFGKRFKEDIKKDEI